MEQSNVKKTAIIAVVIFIGMICFQLLLALGFPIGFLAWGGEYEVLPFELRLASLFAVVIFVIASVLVLSRAEIIKNIDRPKFLKYSVLILAIYFAFNVFMNLLSVSMWEKLIMIPIALSSSILCFIVALGPDSN
ncbi:MAG: hypothetical protein ACFFAO_11950 [Candidatus Hermodarchaeota archaeon]